LQNSESKLEAGKYSAKKLSKAVFALVENNSILIVFFSYFIKILIF